MKIYSINARTILFCVVSVLFSNIVYSQDNWDDAISEKLPETIKKHRAFVSLPNVATNEEDIYTNLKWVKQEFESRHFSVKLLESSTLPVFLAEKQVDKKAKTVLFYLHLDGQAVNPKKWDQEDPFVPVLKQEDENGNWEIIDWDNIDKEINPEWRIFGRAAADDKAPIMMMLTAIDLLEKQKTKLAYNIKIILDSQEEAGSEGFLSTLEQYKSLYSADYMMILDGPAHNTNKPTLTYGCRGIATCEISIYGAMLPQHSGHFGNYAPNPVFSMAHLLSSMKDDNGKVTINGYYDGIEITPEIESLLKNVPDNQEDIQRSLGINKPDKVGNSYQESIQYPSLNVRQIETSWKGPGLKTVIPEIVTAYIDVRLVLETDGAVQLEKIKNHIEKQGYLVLDREPTLDERLSNSKIAKFSANSGVNAFRTDINAELAQKLRIALTKEFGEEPVNIRTMGGTVPIIPAINTLSIPAIIIPLANMDNNQHNPNENIRIGNISQGIKICMVLLSMKI